MKRIDRIVIKGFLSHTHTDITLSPEVNILIGSTDAGKSAIVRAIQWVLFDIPRGNKFINVGYVKEKKPCEVAVYVGNTIVTRIKSADGTNRYTILTNGIETKFDNFGTQVPREVFAALGMHPVDFGEGVKLNINLSNQIETPFLLTDTPRTRALVLGRLVDLDLIDDAIRLGKTEQSQYKKITSEEGTRIIDLTMELGELPDVDRIQINLNQIGPELTELEKVGRDIGRLTYLNEKRKVIVGGVARHQNAITYLEPRITKLNELAKLLEEFQISLNNLKGLKLRYANTRLELHKYGGMVSAIEGALDPLPPLLDSLIEQSKVLIALKVLKRSRDETVGSVAKSTEAVREHKASLTNTTMELETLIDSWEVCPLSGGSLFQECRELLKDTE